MALYPAIDGMRRAAREVLDAAGDAPLRRFGLRPMDVFNLVGMGEWAELES